MAEDTNQNTNPSQQNQLPKSKPKNRTLLIIVLVFAAFWIVVLLTQKKESIIWIEDYEAGIELAEKENKPLLLVFYKPNAPMYTDAANNTYNNPQVKKYVESNFVPILINVVERPDLAKKFKIDYYPTHYVKYPNSDRLCGPRLGWDPPDLFVTEIQNLLDQLNKSKK
jgi:hypothetical protein